MFYFFGGGQNPPKTLGDLVYNLVYNVALSQRNALSILEFLQEINKVVIGLHIILEHGVSKIRIELAFLRGVIYAFL